MVKQLAGIPFVGDTGLPGVPKLSYAVGADYRLTLTDLWDLDLAGSYAWVGRSRLTFDSASAPTMGGYGDVRLSAAMRGPSLTLKLAVDNALDRHGDTLAFGDPFSYQTRAETTPQRPRTVSLTASRRF